MRSKTNNAILRNLAPSLTVAMMLACFSVSASAQQATRGTITGKVTADQGQVVAF